MTGKTAQACGWQTVLKRYVQREGKPGMYDIREKHDLKQAKESDTMPYSKRDKEVCNNGPDLKVPGAVHVLKII